MLWVLRKYCGRACGCCVRVLRASVVCECCVLRVRAPWVLCATNVALFEGNLKYTWLVPLALPDGYIEVHSFSVDPAGNLYGGDNQYGRTQKFVPKPGADPDLLISPAWNAL